MIRLKKICKSFQYYVSLVSVALTTLACYGIADFVGYKVVALLMLVMISLLAMIFDIIPVMIAAILSALIWNFFFIPPLFTFHIADTEDALMFLMYFLIAMVNAVLTIKIRDAEKKARDKEEKEKTINLYNTILNSLSHELRTPISTIIGSVDTLKENSDKLTKVTHDELLTEIETAGIRLNRQVGNLLSMSRLESGSVNLKLDWCDIPELIYSVVQKIPNQTNHVFDVKINENFPLFKLDTGLIEQVLYNILHNAVLYSPAKSLIEIEVFQEGENCVFTISDSGKGFPANEIQFVFDKFYRLPQTKTGGTGLGLSIAKGFTEAHGGRIKLENRKSGGAMFTISVPSETSFINFLKNE